MKKTAIGLLSFAMVVSCGKDDAAKDNQGQGTLKVGSNCPSVGDMTCSGSQLVTCGSSGVWEPLKDCADDNKVCGEAPDAAGVYTCIRDTSNLTCDYEGYTAAMTYVFKDANFGAPYFVFAWDADLTQIQTEEQFKTVSDLVIYVPTNQGAGTVDLTLPASTENCGQQSVCVIGGRNQSKTFVADGGSVNFTRADGDVGGSFAAVLNGVTLVEANVNQETGAVSVVNGGEVWCLDGVSISSTIRRYPCALAGLEGAGQGFCGADTVAVQCQASGDPIVDQLFGGGELVIEFCDSGLTCTADEQAAVAVCQ